MTDRGSATTITPLVVGRIARGEFTGEGLSAGDVWRLLFHGLAAEAGVLARGRHDDDEVAQFLNLLARDEGMLSMAVVMTARRVQSVLGGAGIRSLIYKGPALSIQTTGLWSRRASSDLDVLVDPLDVPEAHSALLADGLQPWSGPAEGPSRSFMFRECEFGYVGAACPVDLHWRFEGSPRKLRLTFDDVWERRTEVAADGISLTTISRPDALLVTAVHGTREMWRKWRWALDAYRQLAALTPGEWPHVWVQARAAGASRALMLAVAVARECGLAGAHLPTPPMGFQRKAAALLAATWDEATIHSPRETLSRRVDKVRFCDSPLAALDDFGRATARQVFAARRSSEQGG